MECYPCYRERFMDEKDGWECRRRSLLGMLLNGLANYRETVRQEALLVIGQTVFRFKAADAAVKRMKYSALCFRKLLFLLNENKGDELTAFYRAAALSNICRFHHGIPFDGRGFYR